MRSNIACTITLDQNSAMKGAAEAAFCGSNTIKEASGWLWNQLLG
jgi:hypothetical protein